MTEQSMIQARRDHRANARAARELVETLAARGPEQARAHFRQTAADNAAAGMLLMMLWGTAITVQLQVRAARGRRG
ncbi:hypothetical protein AB0H37_38275 [Actinomadura sp. NPDC023710]|uniref:hypothetical protein n=1 Tax=Actinomadura sp. NPDC023710 TaxID=3158219 RepID=UPI0033EA316A